MTTQEAKKKLFDMVYMWGSLGLKTDETNNAFQTAVQELFDAMEADQVFEHAKSKECDECQGLGVVPDAVNNGNVIDCPKCTSETVYERADHDCKISPDDGCNICEEQWLEEQKYLR